MPFAEAHEVSDGVEEKLQCTREPTSKVHKKPQGWEEKGILFPHEGVRFLMQELSDAVNSMDPLSAWKWANLLTWYQDYFCSVVHHHHDAEEKIYFPWIETRVQVPAKISAEHPELMQAMDDLSSMLKDGAAAPAGQRAERLAGVQKFVAAFVEDMLEHLAEEEEIIPRLLRDGGFTQEEEGAAVGQIIQSLGLDGNKKALPPMLHAYALWAGKDKAEAFVSGHLPPPIQFLYRNFWEYDFQHRHMGLLASVAEGVDTNPFASKWFC
jgi:hemerythrin-like domain-containing protein